MAEVHSVIENLGQLTRMLANYPEKQQDKNQVTGQRWGHYCSSFSLSEKGDSEKPFASVIVFSAEQLKA